LTTSTSTSSGDAPLTGRRGELYALFLLAAAPLCAQEGSAGGTAGGGAAALGAGGHIEAQRLVGMTLKEVFAAFGAPRSVYAARGEEPWQDDVIFAYKDADLYISGESVWQAGVKEAFGLRIGDKRDVILLTLDGLPYTDRGDCVFFSVKGLAFPVTARFNLSGTGLITSIFVYRPDY